MIRDPIAEARALCDDIDRQIAAGADHDDATWDLFQSIGNLDLIGGVSDEGFRHGLDAALDRIDEEAAEESRTAWRHPSDPDSYLPEWVERQIVEAQREAARDWLEDARDLLASAKARMREAA